MKGFFKGIGMLIYIVAFFAVGVRLESDWSEMCDALIGNPAINLIAKIAFFVFLVFAFVFLWIIFFVDTKKKKSSTPTQSQRPVQAQAPRPTAAAHTAAARPTATQTVRPAQTQTARPAATQSRPVQTQAAKPAAQRTKTVNATSKNIPVDYAKAIPGALKGLLGGFALCLVFGFLASLTSGSSITNLFTPLAGLSLIVCPIIGYINALHDQPGQRKLKADEQAHANDLENRLKANLDILNQGCGVTQESISRYDTACSNLVFLIAWNYFDSRYKHIIMPYYNAVYERTWPVFNWRNGKYEPAIGEELADRLHNEIEKKAKERQEEYERKIRQNTY